MENSMEIIKASPEAVMNYMLEAGLQMLQPQTFADDVLDIQIGAVVDTTWMYKTRGGALVPRTIKAKVVGIDPEVATFEDSVGNEYQALVHLVRYSTTNSLKKLSTRTSQVIFVDKTRLYDARSQYCVEWAMVQNGERTVVPAVSESVVEEEEEMAESGYMPSSPAPQYEEEEETPRIKRARVCEESVRGPVKLVIDLTVDDEVVDLTKDDVIDLTVDNDDEDEIIDLTMYEDVGTTPFVSRHAFRAMLACEAELF